MKRRARAVRLLRPEPAVPRLDSYPKHKDDATWEERLEQFKIFREYIQHEDDLINQRATWNVTIQGFLFAAFALVVQSRIAASNVNPNAQWLIYRTGTYLIPLTGLAVAFVSYFSTRAARQAIERLQDEYETLVIGIHSGSDWMLCEDRRLRKQPLLPKITGGGHPKAASRGFALPHAIPLVFVVAWTLAFGYLRITKVLFP